MKIAVICAFPSATNPGMLSVDLAFKTVQRSLPAATEIVLFCAEAAIRQKAEIHDLNYAYLQEQQQLAGFDRIVYWGDFLHWIAYAKTDWVKRWKVRTPTRSKEEVIDLWYRLFLLESAPDLQKKAVVFGGTLCGLNSVQLLDPRYRSALENLYGNARLVLMRDHLSANLVGQLVPHQVPAFGCDCAFLLDTERELVSAKSNPVRDAPNRYLLSAFGRSGANVALRAFAGKLAETMELPLATLNWQNPIGLAGLGDMLAIVKQADYVVTDIYHLAVSAWREGVPALCVGNGGSYPQSTVSDKKKEILFGQIFASDMYLYVEEILDALRRDAELTNYCGRQVKRLCNDQANQVVHEMIDRQRRVARAHLVEALQR